MNDTLQQTVHFGTRSAVHYARTPDRAAIRAFVERELSVKPPDGVLVKPNLNNDLMALTGNSVDFRVLVPLLAILKDQGVGDITLADGFNVGIDRRGIDGMKRLRVDRLAKHFGIRLLNLNDSESIEVQLVSSTGRVARDVIEAPFLINVCKIKTHAEAVMSCALKNWVGINVAQYKRRMHDALAENIVRMNEIVKPHLLLVDGLIGMEGNGPGDGEPVRLDLMLSGDNSFLVDLTVARMIGFSVDDVPYLAIARQRGHLTADDIERVKNTVPVLRPFRPAAPRTRLAVLAENPRLSWLKRLVRPLVTEGPLLRLAYELKIVQDVYSLQDDTIRDLAINAKAEQRHGALLRSVCPAGWEEIAALSLHGDRYCPFSRPDCLRCMYCYWVLPPDATHLDGDLGHLSWQLRKYKSKIEGLFSE